ncbi:hypothetical protein HQ533_02635 [Candidatus Woesearchaeota archaeon]|nr:hypothetical protein [Candidatus Woesearchaeota archaeon]
MRKAFIFLLALLFVLASCEDGTTSPTNQRSFLGGTEGLEIDFVDGEPPIEVTDGGATPFTVSIKLQNKGETGVVASDVSLTLKGIDAPTFGVANSDIVNQHPAEDILKNDINPDTGDAIDSPPVYYTFPQLNFGESLSGNQPFPFVVDVCYKYQTMATSQLCIKEDLLDSTNQDVCTVTGAKNVQNSGAPIQITEFEEFSAGQNAVSFSFKIKNVGNGLLSRQGTTCEDDPSNKDYLKITVDSRLSGLTCSGLSNTATSGTAYSGEVKLSLGTRQVRCTQQLSESDKTDKVMIVDLLVDYDYEESTNTNVLVKHI